MKSSNIGGQAVMEGIMMRSGDQYSIGVRKPDGEIEVKVEPYRSWAKDSSIWKLPVFRGVASFFESLVVGIRCLMYSASFIEDEEEDAKKPGKEKTEEQKETLHNDLGLTGRIEGMQVQINAMEDLLGEQTEMLNKMVENMTLSTRQQQKLYKAAKDRINKLLDGAHGTKYKCYSKSYFINMWNELKEKFGCSSYKDLNPMYYNEAFDFIAEWEYIER